MLPPTKLTTLPRSATYMLSKLNAARVDFVMLGEGSTPMTIVPAPYARNLKRLANVLGDGAAGDLVVQRELSSRYQELLYESLPREVAADVVVEVVPDGAAGVAPQAEIRVLRAAKSSA